MGFDQAAFDNFALENGVIEFREEPVKLNSGRLSHIYMNWRSPLEDAYLKSELVSRFIIPFINDKGIKARTFYGVPEGATKLGLFVQDEWAKSQKDYQKGAYTLAMGRGRAKEHGAQKDRYFLGSPDGPTVIIEDVTTTGLSVIREASRLVGIGVRVVGIIALTDRMELTPIRRMDGKSPVEEFAGHFSFLTHREYGAARGVKEVMAQAGIPYYSMTDTFRLLHPAVKRLSPSLDVMNSIEEEFNRISVKSRVFASIKRDEEANPIELHKSMATRYSEELSNKKVKV